MYFCLCFQYIIWYESTHFLTNKLNLYDLLIMLSLLLRLGYYQKNHFDDFFLSIHNVFNIKKIIKNFLKSFYLNLFWLSINMNCINPLDVISIWKRTFLEVNTHEFAKDTTRLLVKRKLKGSVTFLQNLTC